MSRAPAPRGNPVEIDSGRRRSPSSCWSYGAGGGRGGPEGPPRWPALRSGGGVGELCRSHRDELLVSARAVRVLGSGEGLVLRGPERVDEPRDREQREEAGNDVGDGGDLLALD